MKQTNPSGKGLAQQVSQNLARPPSLVLHLELEQPARYRIDAATFEDEQRLLGWLRRSSAVEALVEDVRRVLDERDDA